MARFGDSFDVWTCGGGEFQGSLTRGIHFWRFRGDLVEGRRVGEGVVVGGSWWGVKGVTIRFLVEGCMRGDVWRSSGRPELIGARGAGFGGSLSVLTTTLACGLSGGRFFKVVWRVESISGVSGAIWLGMAGLEGGRGEVVGSRGRRCHRWIPRRKLLGNHAWWVQLSKC